MEIQASTTPWRNWDEWAHVRRLILSSDEKDRELGLKHIGVWRIRGDLPHAVDCTASFLDLLSTRGETTSLDLRHSLSMAIVRFVNGLADSEQQNLMFAVSVINISKQLCIPRLCVDVRHEASHNQLPSLASLMEASKQALMWLNTNYWSSSYFSSILSIQSKLSSFFRLYAKHTSRKAENRADSRNADSSTAILLPIFVKICTTISLISPTSSPIFYTGTSNASTKHQQRQIQFQQTGQIQNIGNENSNESCSCRVPRAFYSYIIPQVLWRLPTESEPDEEKPSADPENGTNMNGNSPQGNEVQYSSPPSKRRRLDECRATKSQSKASTSKAPPCLLLKFPKQKCAPISSRVRYVFHSLLVRHSTLLRAIFISFSPSSTPLIHLLNRFGNGGEFLEVSGEQTTNTTETSPLNPPELLIICSNALRACITHCINLLHQLETIHQASDSQKRDNSSNATEQQQSRRWQCSLLASWILHLCARVLRASSLDLKKRDNSDHNFIILSWKLCSPFDWVHITQVLSTNCTHLPWQRSILFWLFEQEEYKMIMQSSSLSSVHSPSDDKCTRGDEVLSSPLKNVLCELLKSRAPTDEEDDDEMRSMTTMDDFQLESISDGEDEEMQARSEKVEEDDRLVHWRPCALGESRYGVVSTFE